MPQVETVYYVSQQQAYSEFRQYFSNEPALVQDTQEGDIPDSFQVKLKNPESDYNIVASAVTGTPGVETVVDEMTILDKFYKLLDGARNAVLIIALILIVAAVLLVANTIRLSAFNRRRETGDHAPGRGLELLHPAAVPARGGDRRLDRLGHRGGAPCGRQVPHAR